MNWIDRAARTIADAYGGTDAGNLNEEFISTVIRNHFNMHLDEALNLGEKENSALMQDFEID